MIIPDKFFERYLSVKKTAVKLYFLKGKPLPHWLPYKREKNFPLVISGGVFTAIIFVADLMTPLGVAGGVPYIGAVLIGFLIPGRKYIIAASVGGSILTILAFLLLPYPGNIEVWEILVNRGLALFAIWSVAILGLYYKRSEKEVQERISLDRLLRTSAIASNEISDFEQAARICLSNICKTIDWEVGHLYKVNENSSRLHSTKVWSLKDPDRFKIFRGVTEQTDFDPGIGLPGRVLASAKPAWITDVNKDPNFPRAKLAKDLGVKSGVAFPVKTGNRIVAVLEFFSKQNMALDPLLLETMESVGAQLGRVFEREQAEKALKEHAANLKAANEEIKSFAYIVSHDLRAPLVNIMGFSKELETALQTALAAIDKFMPQLEEKQRSEVTEALEKDIPEALDFINHSAERMDSLINAVLELSRLGRRNLKLEKVSMNSVVDSTLKTLDHKITRNLIRIKVHPLPEINADRISMEQIMTNLLNNAIIYLDKDRTGEIEVSGEQLEGETVFRVRDNGRGIARDDREKIFEIFRRSGNRNVAGEGMGLAYAHKLVRRHNGRLWCESELGKGSTFAFTIPNHITDGDLHE